MTASRCRVMTFNVRFDSMTDGANNWEYRRSIVASVIRYHAPDVVGLQEPLPHQYAELRDALPDYDWAGVGRQDGDAGGEHCPIGWQSKVRVEAHGTVWLSETPDEPGSSYPSASKPRLVTWARASFGGRPFVVCNTHFDHKSEEARVRSAEQLRTLVSELGGWDGERLERPVVVLGDFNCTVGSEPYRILTAERTGTPTLSDAMAVSEHPHHGPTTTFERFSGEPTEKIDHVFVAGDVGVRQHAVVADHWDGRPPSDHCPVLAELVL